MAALPLSDIRFIFGFQEQAVNVLSAVWRLRSEQSGESVNKEQLETWLLGADAPALPDSARSRRFVLAVLRDLFPTDVDVQVWLTTPRDELKGATARELLTSVRIGEVETLVVRLWNQA